MAFNWFRRSFDKSDASKPDASKPEAKPAEPAAQPEPEVDQAAEAAPAALSPEDYLKWAKAAYQNIQKQQAPTPEPEAAPATPDVEVTEATVDAEDSPTEEPALEAGVTEEPVAEASAVEASAVAEPVAAEPVVEEPAAEEPVAEELAVEEPAAEEPAVEESAVVETVAEAPTLQAEVLNEPENEPEPTIAEIEPEVADVPAAAPDAPTEPVVAPEPVAPPVAAPFWAKAEAERQQRLERLKETAIVEPEPEPEPAPVAATPVAPVLPDIDLDEAFLWSAEVLASQGRRPDDISLEEITWLNKLRQGLNKTRLGLVNQLKAIVGQGPLNDDAVMEIEALLLQADVGIAATDKVIAALQARMREEVLPPDQAIAYLKTILRDMLDAPLNDSHNLTFVPEKETFNIWLMTGVNGAGKTTTIGKLAHIAKKSGYNTLIAAADTFRAAAVEQVKAWGARSEVEVIANPGQNTDPAAVVYDAIAASQSRQIELLLVDTAGRLQNKKNLMDELAKIRRIVDKKAPDAKIEALLVLDATLGQNGLRQAEVFAEAANLSGVVLTKLDGTARGGVALAVVEQLGLPIRFIGAGEGIEDLRPFSSYEFVEALLSG
jgi:fused signal recognition particle receptor